MGYHYPARYIPIAIFKYNISSSTPSPPIIHKIVILEDESLFFHQQSSFWMDTKKFLFPPQMKGKLHPLIKKTHLNYHLFFLCSPLALLIVTPLWLPPSRDSKSNHTTPCHPCPVPRCWGRSLPMSELVCCPRQSPFIPLEILPKGTGGGRRGGHPHALAPPSSSSVAALKILVVQGAGKQSFWASALTSLLGMATLCRLKILVEEGGKGIWYYQYIFKLHPTVFIVCTYQIQLYSCLLDPK